MSLFSPSDIRPYRRDPGQVRSGFSVELVENLGMWFTRSRVTQEWEIIHRKSPEVRATPRAASEIGPLVGACSLQNHKLRLLACMTQSMISGSLSCYTLNPRENFRGESHGGGLMVSLWWDPIYYACISKAQGPFHLPPSQSSDRV